MHTKTSRIVEHLAGGSTAGKRIIFGPQAFTALRTFVRPQPVMGRWTDGRLPCYPNRLEVSVQPDALIELTWEFLRRCERLFEAVRAPGSVSFAPLNRGHGKQFENKSEGPPLSISSYAHLCVSCEILVLFRTGIVS
jgi:hypothetical protein